MRAAEAPREKRLPIVLIAALTVIWLLLSQSLAVGHILLGALLATALGAVSGLLRPVPRVRRLYEAPLLVAVVVGDIIRSNIGVGRIVLGLTGGRKVTSGFVRIPLELREPHALAVLASIVTSTPGTVWVGLDTTTNTLTLHVLDLKSEQEWIEWIKNRYERRLLRIFA